MLGIAHHNADVISIILDRKLVCSHTIVKSDPDWSKGLASFFHQPVPDNRKRVILSEEVSFLNRLKMELDALGAKDANMAPVVGGSVFLLFDTPDSLMRVDNIHILDASKKEDSWVLNKLAPVAFNKILCADQSGFPKALPSFKVPDPDPPKEKEDEPVPTFDPVATLYFQGVENYLSVILEESQRQTLRQLISAWVEGALSAEYEDKIKTRLKKYGINVSGYLNWESQAQKQGYLSNLRKSCEVLAKEPQKVLKELAKEHNVRVGDIKWLDKNWPVSNLNQKLGEAK